MKKTHVLGALLLVGLGVLLGVIGQRSHWFGLGKQRLGVEESQAFVLSAPYDAWGGIKGVRTLYLEKGPDTFSPIQSTSVIVALMWSNVTSTKAP